MRPSCHCAIGSPAVAASWRAANCSADEMPPPAPSIALAMACAASAAVLASGIGAVAAGGPGISAGGAGGLSCAKAGTANSSADNTLTEMRAEAPLDIRILLLFALRSWVGERAKPRRTNQLGILPDRARAIFGLARCPALLALGKFLVADVDRNLAGHRVERDDVAILDQGDRAADRSFRPDMADAEAARCAREPPVGDERNLVAHALAVERRRGRQHFAHARAALGALVADDENLAFLIGTIVDRLEALLFGIEHACRADEALALEAGDLHDRTVG